jgi:hypothetical protein
MQIKSTPSQISPWLLNTASCYHLCHQVLNASSGRQLAGEQGQASTPDHLEAFEAVVTSWAVP